MQAVGVQFPPAVLCVEFPHLPFAGADQQGVVIHECHTANAQGDFLRNVDGLHNVPGGQIAGLGGRNHCEGQCGKENLNRFHASSLATGLR